MFYNILLSVNMKSVSKYRIWRFTIGQYDTTVFPQNGHIPVAKQQYLMTNCQTFCFFLFYHVSALLTFFISGMFNKVTQKQIHNSKWALYGGSLLLIMKSIKTTYLKQLGTEWHRNSHVRLQVLVQNNGTSRLTLIWKVASKKLRVSL